MTKFRIIQFLTSFILIWHFFVVTVHLIYAEKVDKLLAGQSKRCEMINFLTQPQSKRLRFSQLTEVMLQGFCKECFSNEDYREPEGKGAQNFFFR